MIPSEREKPHRLCLEDILWRFKHPMMLYQNGLFGDGEPGEMEGVSDVFTIISQAIKANLDQKVVEAKGRFENNDVSVFTTHRNTGPLDARYVTVQFAGGALYVLGAGMYEFAARGDETYDLIDAVRGDRAAIKMKNMQKILNLSNLRYERQIESPAPKYP